MGTATSFNAYWEGKKYIINMVTEIRNLCRLIWIVVPETTQLEHDNKIIHIKLLLGFAYACRHALLEESGVFQDFENLIPMDLKRHRAQESMCLPNQILYKVWPAGVQGDVGRWRSG